MSHEVEGDDLPDKGAVKQKLGTAIAAFRRDLLLTQEDVAHRAGISVPYLSEVERGRRNIAAVNIVRVAAAMKLKAADLFQRADL